MYVCAFKNPWRCQKAKKKLNSLNNIILNRTVVWDPGWKKLILLYDNKNLFKTKKLKANKYLVFLSKKGLKHLSTYWKVAYTIFKNRNN